MMPDLSRIRRMALIGANGMLASMVRQVLPSGYELFPLDLPQFDLTDADLVRRVLGEISPDIILNCAAFTAVDRCEQEEVQATRVNGEGPGNLADFAREAGATLVHISTDYVFAGDKETPYLEDDRPAPQSAYGRSKLAGEQAILDSGLERYFIVRTSWLYGPGGPNFVETMIRLANERQELRIVADQIGSPTCTADLAEAVFNLLALEDGDLLPQTYGIYHFSNNGACSWYDFTCEIVTCLKGQGMDLAVERILPIKTDEYPLPAPRPAYSVLSKQKYLQATGAVVPSWQDGLRRYLAVRGLAPQVPVPGS